MSVKDFSQFVQFNPAAFDRLAELGQSLGDKLEKITRIQFDAGLASTQSALAATRALLEVREPAALLQWQEAHVTPGFERAAASAREQYEVLIETRDMISAALQQSVVEATLIVTPGRLSLPAGLDQRRATGLMAQLYQVRSSRSWGVGDLGDLATLATWGAERLGADFVLINPLHAAEPLEYYDARKLADADEAGVTGPARDAMLAAQRKLLDAGVVECSLGKPQKDFSAFAIVMRLDAQGVVQQTWRQGGSPLAICLQRYLRDKTVFVPPRAPFHTTLDISFTK